MPSYEQITYEIENRVARITLNRPDRQNAWSIVMEGEFRDALQHAEQDEVVRAIVITGAGKVFCVGADMARLAKAQQPKLDARLHQSGNFNQRYSYIMNISKPTIAAINGSIAGVGLCISLYCDLRYMVEDAKLSTAFARRGLIAEHGIAWMLPRLIGPMNATDLLISGRAVATSEAASMGLVRMLPKEGFLDTVQETALQLATLSSPRSIRIIKQQIREAYLQDLATATKVADREQLGCRNTQDLKEGVAHFVERRTPQFTGR